MKEYLFENGSEVDLNKLKSPKFPFIKYIDAHKSLVILCHDVFVEYQGGILLIRRNNYPAKNTLWPLGGRIERGITILDSLKKKVLIESNVELYDIKFIGHARTFFETEPFGHGRGTDTFNLVYYAKGKGKLKLDDDHSEPTIITKKDLQELYSKCLHPYVNDFLKTIYKNNYY